MGKASMCIRMLQILNTGRVYKVSELADLLETNPRNILEYKKELNEVATECGYEFFIDTVPGRDGGYQLNGNAIIPSTKLTEDERRAFSESFKFLMSNDSFINKDSTAKVYAKIMSNMLIDDKNLELISVNKFSLSNLKKVKLWFEVLNDCIKNKKVIKMSYNFLKEPKHEVEVHPYQLFMYDNEWRFIGWNCEIGDIFYFKLSRIESITVTNNKFQVWKYYKFENYVKNGVFTQSGEMFSLTLIASGIRAKLFKERDFGTNQVCEDLPDGRTKITMEMQKNPSTYNFILGCGDLVEVVEPEWLRDKIKELAQTILEKYK